MTAVSTTTTEHVTGAPVRAASRQPIIGNTLEFKRDRLRLFQKVYEECGEVGSYTLAGVKVVFLNSVEAVDDALIKNGGSFEKSDRFRTFARPLLGEGLLTASNESHKIHRRIIQPPFREAVVRHTANVSARTARRIAESWADGSTIDARRHMVRLVLSVVGESLFSRDILAEADELGDALTDAITGFDAQARAQVPLDIRWPTPANLRYRRAIVRLEKTLNAIMDERRELEEAPDDWLNLLMKARYSDGSPLPARQIRDEALNLFMPGHETTATGLAWALHLLDAHPEHRDRLTAEVDAVLGDRLLTAEDLPRLPFAMQVFKEALRLYPPVYMFTRQAVRDVTVRGYHLPAGTVIAFSPYTLHRRDDYYPDPERFDPRRFEPEAEKARPRHAWIPFGAGHRVCIGQHHSLLTGQVALATLAQAAVLTRTTPDTPPLDPQVTLRPEGELPMQVTRR